MASNTYAPTWVRMLMRFVSTCKITGHVPTAPVSGLALGVEICPGLDVMTLQI